MYEIVCIGNNPSLINSLRMIKNIHIAGAIVETGKESLLSDCLGEDANLFCVSNAKELDVAIDEIASKDFALMYDFGIRVGEKTIEKMPIYNFHPGDLKTNRGSSPINWSILDNDELTKMTLYRITRDFDLGEIMVERSCRVYSMDVPSTLRHRMEGEIPSMILELIIKINQGIRGESLSTGVYRKRISEQDYTINEGDSLDVINAKIRSQYDYKGAIIMKGEKKVYVDDTI